MSASEPRRVKIAARTSDLAKVQALTVGARLQKAHPGLQVEYEFRKSLGDIHQHDPLWKMPEKGVFTEDFKSDLLSGACDLVVHSWKDLPVEEHPETRIAATLEREDVRDLLVMKKKSRTELESGSRHSVTILSSSPRRAYNLGPFLSETLPSASGEVSVEFHPVRGNIPTRLRKLLEGPEDGLIVAKAALDRLLGAEGDEWASVRQEIRSVLDQVSWMVLPIRRNPAAAAQGALAIEIRRDREDLAQLLAPIHCEQTFRTVRRERHVLKSYGGGCHQKIGVTCLARTYGEVFSLQGLTDQGKVLSEFRIEASTPRTSARVLRSQLWPATQEEVFHAFDREELKISNPGGALWISKAEALPKGWMLTGDQIVWASGIESWKKLARRGIWVNGSAEGLGEHEDPRIDLLSRGGAPSFTKLSHAGGAKNDIPILATYVLRDREIPVAELEDLFARKTHFYWMSASLFEYCVKRVPAIRSREHACGPGNTAQILSQLLGKSVPVYAGIEQWREESANE